MKGEEAWPLLEGGEGTREERRQRPPLGTCGEAACVSGTGPPTGVLVALQGQHSCGRVIAYGRRRGVEAQCRVLPEQD